MKKPLLLIVVLVVLIQVMNPLPTIRHFVAVLDAKGIVRKGPVSSDDSVIFQWSDSVTGPDKTDMKIGYAHLSLSSHTSDTYLPISAKRCTCISKRGRTTIYYAIIPKEYAPVLRIANDTNHTVESASVIAKRYHATVCVNAGLFQVDTSRTRGYTIVDSAVINDQPFTNKYTTDYLYMTESGELQLFPVDGTLEALTELKPRWAVLGFHPIVSDGKYVAYQRDPDDYSPRTFIGQDYDGNYILGACSGRMTDEVGATLHIIYELTEAIGFQARILYNLDGGGSSAFVYKGKRLNMLTQGEDRPCANYLLVYNTSDQA